MHLTFFCLTSQRAILHEYLSLWIQVYIQAHIIDHEGIVMYYILVLLQWGKKRIDVHSLSKNLWKDHRRAASLMPRKQ